MGHDNRVYLLVLDVAGVDFRMADLSADAELASIQLLVTALGASLSSGLASFWLADQRLAFPLSEISFAFLWRPIRLPA